MYKSAFYELVVLENHRSLQEVLEKSLNIHKLACMNPEHNLINWSKYGILFRDEKVLDWSGFPDLELAII